MKKIIKRITSLSLVVILVSLTLVYAAEDPFEGWNDDTKSYAWDVFTETDWEELQDSLTMDTNLNNITSKIAVSPSIENLRTEIEEYLLSTKIKTKYGKSYYTDIMLVILDTIGDLKGGLSGDIYNIRKYIDPTMKNIDRKESTQIMFEHLIKCMRQNSADLFKNDEVLLSAVEGIMLTEKYTKKYPSYTYDNAKKYYDENKEYFKAKGINPILDFSKKVLSKYHTVNVGGGNDTIVATAMSQVGHKGGAIYNKWMGLPPDTYWCSTFVSWCAEKSGLGSSMLKTASCQQGVNWFKNNNRWAGRNHNPKPGQLIYFDWQDGGSIYDHVGIVKNVENGVVYTIEGNNNNEVRCASYDLGSKVILGYGLPMY